MSNEIRTLYEGQFLKLLRDRHWEYVKRQRATGAGFIIAMTDADELVLVEQERVPLGDRRVIELPAGIIGDSESTADESVQHSALRELEEETGFRGSHAEIVCSGPVAAGMTCEMGYFTRITGLTRIHDGGGVDGENIKVHRVPLVQVPQWLQQKIAEGLLIDPRIFIALYFIQNPAAKE